MPKGVPNKRYTPEFKKQIVETMLEEGLSYSETERRFDLPNKSQSHGTGSIWKMGQKNLLSNAEGAVEASVIGSL